MFTRDFECPSCGGNITRTNPATKILCCPYCGQTSVLGDNSLSAVGEKQLLLDYGSSFELGKKVTLPNKDEYLVIGRLRLDYKGGFWDEWYLMNFTTGETAWLQEDDGSFVLFKQEKEIANPASFDFDAVTVGTYDDLQGIYESSVFVTEKGLATVNGGEGELPFRVVPGEKVHYIDGILQGYVMSLEWMPNEAFVYRGKPFKLEQLVLS